MGTNWSGRNGRVRTAVLVTALALLVLAGALLLPTGHHATTLSLTPGHREAEHFRKLCSDFLNGEIAAQDFCAQARPPWVTQAMRQAGQRVPTTLPLSGTVTLKGRTDHSGTEVAALVVYDRRDIQSVILSPVLVVTDKRGQFDLSTLKMEAWKALPKGAASGNIFCNTCYATPPVGPPVARLLIRHKGFDSRVVRVDIGHDLAARLARNGKSTLHAGGLELLPTGTVGSCYKALGVTHYPSVFPWYPFNTRACWPRKIRAHLATHPDCPVADDALHCLLFYNADVRPDASLPPDVVEDGFRLFRARFMDGRDNTGLSWLFQPGVSPDGSWGKLIEALEAEFYPKYYQDKSAKVLASIVRETPEHIRYVPMIRFVPSYPSFSPYTPTQPPEKILDEDATYLVYLGLTRKGCWTPACRAILEMRDRRAVPILIAVLKAGVDETGAQRPYSPTWALRTLTGEDIGDVREWLSWWKHKGSKLTWPAPPAVRFPAGWLGPKTSAAPAPPARPRAEPEAPPAMFRGNPQRTGVYPFKGIASAPRLARKHRVPGGVYSTPVVVGGIVCFGGGDGRFYALDAQTLESLWVFKAGRRVHCSPAIAKGAVFFGDDSGMFYALDAETAMVRWAVKTGGRVLSAPLVSEGIVYFFTAEGKFLYALDAASGREKWKAEASPYYSSSPSLAGNVLYVGDRVNRLEAFNARTGEKIETLGLSGSVLTAPAIRDGVIYCGTDRPNLTALDTKPRGHVKWEFETEGRVESSPAVSDTTVYFGSLDGFFYALDVGTGKQKWRFRAGGKIRSSPVLVTGTVYFGRWDGILFAVAAETGELRWKVRPGEQLRTSPVPSDGAIYIGAEDGLYLLREPPR